MKITIGPRDIDKGLKRIDPSARISGTLQYPEAPSVRKDLAVVKSVRKEGTLDVTNAIFLFWKSEDGRTHRRTLATAPASRYEFFISKIYVLGVRDDERDNEVGICFFAPVLGGPALTKEIIGKLAEGARRWECSYPKHPLRY